MVESRQSAALGVIVFFPILASLFVCARALSRYLGRNFGWDDWLIFVSLFLVFGETISAYGFILASHTGYHVYDLPKQTLSQQVVAMKWSFAIQMFYHPMMGTIRASIIMFLFRVQDTRRHIYSALQVVFWINMGYMVSTTLVNIFQCMPVHYVYLKPKLDHLDADGNTIKGGKCIDSLAFILASCALSIVMDLIIIPIPTAMVWNLQMPRKTKIAVVIIMSMGWIATAVSVVRFIVYYHRFSPANKDRTWDIGLIVSIIEPCVAVMAACAPATKCLLRRLMPQYFSDTNAYIFTSRERSHPRSLPRRLSSSLSSETNELGVHIDEGTSGPGRCNVHGIPSFRSADCRAKAIGAIEAASARSGKTEHTVFSESEEAVPKNMLNRHSNC